LRGWSRKLLILFLLSGLLSLSGKDQRQSQGTAAGHGAKPN
jgi:hypothetical protein